MKKEHLGIILPLVFTVISVVIILIATAHTNRQLDRLENRLDRGFAETEAQLKSIKRDLEELSN